jgi:hypothetical protein
VVLVNLGDRVPYVESQSWEGRALFKILKAKIGLLLELRVNDYLVILASKRRIIVPLARLH